MPVGIAYDPVFLEHDTGFHPEAARRLAGIDSFLLQEGVLDAATSIQFSPASDDQLLLVHDRAHIKRVSQLAALGGGYYDSDTVMSAASDSVARHAVGACIAATQQVQQGALRSAFALVRPPGHHALPERGMGFCLYNNVAIAAVWAVRELGLQRISIVDIDVHHGNGTQAAVGADPRIQYISTHQAPFYPFTGDYDDVGPDSGQGTCVNIPLPAGTGDLGYALAADRIIRPALERFQPQLILVSVGFDTHWAEPLAWMSLSLAGSANLLRVCKEAAEKCCDGRMVLSLEGGYEVDVLRAGIAAGLAVLMGLPVSDPYGPSLEQEPPIVESIDRMVVFHQLQ